MSLKRLFSHFVTPSLTPSDRQAWMRALGLENAPFHFVEMSGTQTLRSCRIHGAEFFPLLSPLENTELPVWKLIHETSTAVIAPAWPAGGLWETLFPYPLRLLPLAFSPKPAVRLQISPDATRAEWQDLHRAFLKVEERLSETEISCLWVRPPVPLSPLPILTHFVRRRCLRVGTAPHLRALGEGFEKGELDAQVLEAHFGTRAAFFALDLAQSNVEMSPLHRLTAALEATARNPQHAVEARHRDDELDFRL